MISLHQIVVIAAGAGLGSHRAREIIMVLAAGGIVRDGIAKVVFVPPTAVSAAVIRVRPARAPIRAFRGGDTFHAVVIAALARAGSSRTSHVGVVLAAA